MTPGAARVLLVGVSVRAVAESAVRAGFRVAALDAFGDLDLVRRVPDACSLPRDLGVPYGSVAAARTARDVPCDAVAYVAGFENSPRAVAMLAAGGGRRTLWGNPPAVLRAVRDPVRLARAFAARGIAAPATAAGGWAVRRAASVAWAGRDWLAKRRRSGGGHGVRVWTPGDPLERGSVLQERVGGTPGSVVFVADGRGGAVPIGISRQLVGESAFGAAGFTYCGSVLAPAGDAQFDDDAALAERAGALAAAAAEAFGLVGACGVDFVAREGVPVPIEVNPRYSASMELVERAYGLSVFAAHARACADGALPAFDLAHARRHSRGAVGKAIVYARRGVTLGDTTRWLDDDSLRDVPHPGERIRAGRPICTVLAGGDDAAACRAALARRAARVYEEVEWTRRRTA